MARSPVDGKIPEPVPTIPLPAADTARAGIDVARELAQRYLPNSVRMLAAIALSPDSVASLHTRQQCIKQMSDIAGVVPQVLPSAPPPLVDEHGVDGGYGD
jgi:hypothetical protein